jgi:glycosyltransferase involved in cell wall biosynthesis
MHIAVVSTFYPNTADPVRAVFVRNLVAALERYAELTIVSPVPYAPPIRNKVRWRALRSIPRMEIDDGREVLHPRYVVVPRCDAINGFTYFAGTLRTLRVLMCRHRIDLLHAHCAFPDAVGVARLASWLKLPFVVTVHGSDINVYGERFLIRDQIKWALGRAAAVIAVSADLKDKVSRLVPLNSQRVVHIPCAGVDSRIFKVIDQKTARRSLGLDEDGRIVMFVGRLVPIKAVDVLLRAWRRLRLDGRVLRNDCLVIVGDGPERAALEAQSCNNELQDIVRFVGDFSQEKIAAWLGAASAFCLPSRNEGTPNVIIEALASGRPVVASRVGGVPEVVSEGVTGLLVESGNEALLAQALATALERQWDAEQIAASVANYTWDILGRRNIATLQAVLTEREARAACAP